MQEPTSPTFDPALTGSAENGIFGVESSLERAILVYIPVPWEVTTSYGGGTSLGPEAILQASPQLDLYIRGLDNHVEKGFFLLQENAEIRGLNGQCKPLARAVQDELEQSGSLIHRPDLEASREQVNAAGRQLNQLIYQQAETLDQLGKHIALIGGDHSTPLGLIHYLSDKYQGDFGVLHIDAHHDLRDSYQGFHYSHASIMHNVLALPKAPKALVQVAIRDFSREEADLASRHPAVHTFYDEDIKDGLFAGKTFASIADAIIWQLPEKVYISFDIDGLQPDLCPHTGTPVAGGLSLEQAQYLIKTLVRQGKTIIGFDLCEVAPDSLQQSSEWDGNVGARVLYMLSSWMMESQVSQ